MIRCLRSDAGELAYGLRKVVLPLKLEEGYKLRVEAHLGHHLMLERQRFLLPELEMQKVFDENDRFSA